MTDTKKTLIRLPASLYALIETRAAASLRSINSEMIALLKIGLIQNRKEAELLSAADDLLAKNEKKKK